MTIMKKLVFCLALVSLLLVSCSKERKKTGNHFGQKIEFVKEDTVQINSLVTEFMDKMNNQKLEEAADMLYIVKDGKPVAYTAQQKKGFVTAYTLLPVKSCKLMSYELIDEFNNQAKLQVELDIPSENKAPKMTKIFLNPIMVDDDWYLTTLDPEAEGVDRSEYYE